MAKKKFETEDERDLENKEVERSGVIVNATNEPLSPLKGSRKKRSDVAFPKEKEGKF